jgi:AraC-like DNA-binding protein
MGTLPGCGPTGTLWDSGYREWLPDRRFREAIACLWVAVAAADAPASVAAVMPDGCSDLIWQYGKGAFVAGPDTRPAPADIAPGTILVGVRFRPGAGGPALGWSLADVRDQRVDLADLSPRLAGQLPAELMPHQALQTVTDLTAGLVAAGPPDKLVMTATRLLASGQACVADLAPALAVSERQLRRRFETAVGYGPKTTQRVLRFRRVLQHLAAAPRSTHLGDLAARVGYADQAHLTRETTSLAGLTPAALAQSFVAAH